MNSEMSDDDRSVTSENIKKKPKRGIIYISSIPPYMNVTKIREYFGNFGTLGRVFLQLDDKGKNSIYKRILVFLNNIVHFQ